MKKLLIAALARALKWLQPGGCSKRHCHNEATVKRLGKPFCSAHDQAIASERRRTGQLGPILDREGNL